MILPLLLTVDFMNFNYTELPCEANVPPPAIVRKISADTNTALADPAIKDKLAQTGYLAEGSSPEELGQLLKSEIAKWSAVIKSVCIKID